MSSGRRSKRERKSASLYDPSGTKKPKTTRPSSVGVKSSSASPATKNQLSKHKFKSNTPDICESILQTLLDHKESPAFLSVAKTSSLSGMDLETVSVGFIRSMDI